MQGCKEREVSTALFVVVVLSSKCFAGVPRGFDGFVVVVEKVSGGTCRDSNERRWFMTSPAYPLPPPLRSAYAYTRFDRSLPCLVVDLLIFIRVFFYFVFTSCFSVIFINNFFSICSILIEN